MILAESEIQTREVLDWQGVHLFHYRESSCSQKTRIFLRLKGIAWTAHEIDLAKQQNYSPCFLGINPRGQVPVLVHDGAVHIESNDILVYLDEHFDTSVLIPEEHRQHILDRLRDEDALHRDLRALTMRFIVPRRLAMKSRKKLRNYEAHAAARTTQDPVKTEELEFWREYRHHGVTNESARQSAQRFRAAFEALEVSLDGQSFLLGSNITALDIAWFIYVHRLKRAGYPLRRLHPRLYAWYRRLIQLQAFREEVRTPASLWLVTGVLHFYQKFTGRTLENIGRLQ